MQREDQRSTGPNANPVGNIIVPHRGNKQIILNQGRVKLLQPNALIFVQFGYIDRPKPPNCLSNSQSFWKLSRLQGITPDPHKVQSVCISSSHRVPLERKTVTRELPRSGTIPFQCQAIAYWHRGHKTPGIENMNNINNMNNRSPPTTVDGIPY